MAENKMADVAAIFGQTLGKNFYIEGKRYPYVFKEDGLYENGFVGDTPMLIKLLTGKTEIKKHHKRRV